MGSKALVIFCFLLLAVLLIISDVKARDLDETSSYQQEGKTTASEMNKVNDEKTYGWNDWGPGYGGPGGGYRGGYGGPGRGNRYCRHGCCNRYYGRCIDCCDWAGQKETEAQPKN